ncbi:MAG: hypothetical protein ACREUL_18585 [Steroidobacteraceae bacterium]
MSASAVTDPAAALHRDLLEQLADIRRQIEAHGTAVYMLKIERQQLREQLIRSGWKPLLEAAA